MLTAIRGPATRLYFLPPKYAEVRPGLRRQLGKTTYTSKDWALAVLAHLQNADWGLPTVWISDRDPKFVRGLKLIFGFDLRMPWNLLYNAFARSDLAPRQDAAECLKYAAMQMKGFSCRRCQYFPRLDLLHRGCGCGGPK